MNRQEADNQLRDLRARAGRLRRQMDRRADRLAEQSLLAVAPARFIQEHPLKSLIAAASLGASLSGFLKHRELLELAKHFPTVREWLRDITSCASEEADA